MKVIIQCAGSKSKEARYFHAEDGTKLQFVADPQKAPVCDRYRYVSPDDTSDRTGKSWRDLLVEYNRHASSNPFGLCEAYRLYRRPIYTDLVEHLGKENVFILSAGWGLVSAGFLLPNYDITFSRKAKSYKRRKPSDTYHDLCSLSEETADEDLVFFGGKDYLPLLESLIGRIPQRKIVYYRTAMKPSFGSPSWHAIKYHTSRSTNWHYDCAQELVEGTLSLT